ncbi:hypothetical protein QFC22_003631 [Naganishia vaughanmartiniae]|uniref:Uncharacterized protein n=1 Tax=Naganishia vaughanmartiniae TaxID=1424756 RepID=A0ACC2X543_9TREE|nr:hypothetical protein QFC22_003631 [Naganishia vaughanmartiniae]
MSSLRQERKLSMLLAEMMGKMMRKEEIEDTLVDRAHKALLDDIGCDVDPINDFETDTVRCAATGNETVEDRLQLQVYFHAALHKAEQQGNGQVRDGSAKQADESDGISLEGRSSGTGSLQTNYTSWASSLVRRTADAVAGLTGNTRGPQTANEPTV